MLRVKSSGQTDTGLLRTHNEDYFRIDDARGLYVVADGMGGHNHGEVASRIAVEAMTQVGTDDSADNGLSSGPDGSLREHSKRLKGSIHLAHDQVLQAIRQDGSLLGMGTTVVGISLDDDVAAIAHVGDSRAYRIRNGHMELLTQDHTWVNEQVVAGYLSEEQAKSHPLKNVVTRALGGDSEVVVDVLETRLRDGDLFLLCSDGLTTMLSDLEIHERVLQDEPIETICQQLIADANARGGFDNVTVVMLEIDGGSDEITAVTASS